MSDSTLTSFSNQLADAVAAVSPSVVQVRGRRRPASGVVFAPDVIVTTARAIGREDGLQITAPDGRVLDAELAGWDLTTHVAVLKVPGLGAPAAAAASTPTHVGHLALGVGRSWSNSLTASAGIVAVIGGPLATGRRRAIDQVIRITAPMHEGFAGGACVDASGGVTGIITAARIRGFRVVIPATIAWKAAQDVLEHGRPRRGYLGVAGQAVQLAPGQRPAEDRETAVLIVAVTPASPAEAAGLIVGDVLTDFDGQPIESPEDLLDVLVGDRVGRDVELRVVRGGTPKQLSVKVGEK
ncbi:MAG TPA: PDZ domain-containing protein [Vicinamibacterales bacterium]|nr:PDZ domain-containing protein [Vicinamibacterales bacterium]